MTLPGRQTLIPLAILGACVGAVVGNAEAQVESFAAAAAEWTRKYPASLDLKAQSIL